MFLFVISGCKNNETVFFCEGITPDGETVKCGKKFYSGDLTVVIRTDGKNEESILVKVDSEGRKNGEFQKEIKTEKNKPVNSIVLPFYNEGKYNVKAYSGDLLISSGEVEIIE